MPNTQIFSWPLVIAMGLVFVFGRPVGAQPCEPEWTQDASGTPGVAGTVRAIAQWDDGTGEAIYVGWEGRAVGQISETVIARFDGDRWTALSDDLGSRIRGRARKIAVLDDGTGEALYVGGTIDRIGDREVLGIARWDGRSWSSVGDGLIGDLEELTMFDDGSGPAIYAGGSFFRSGGRNIGSLARWDGTQWIAAGAAAGMFGGDVESLAVRDGVLYIGGDWLSVDDVPIGRVVSWDGNAWSAVGGQIGFFPSDTVQAVCWHDDGSGPALYAAGRFAEAGGTPVSNIARWDGVQWSAVGGGLNGLVFDLASIRTSEGPRLVATGLFDQAGGVDQLRLAAWDGEEWGPMPGDMPGQGLNGSGGVDLQATDEGATDALYVGGTFSQTGRVGLQSIGRWFDGGWAPVGRWLGGTGSPVVTTLVELDDGSGPALYATGRFWAAGGEQAGNVARWDGQGWTPIGTELSAGDESALVRSLVVFDDGSGPVLYASGSFFLREGAAQSAVARWSGAAWEPVGLLPPGGSGITTLAVFDRGDGAALYAGGASSRSGPGGQTTNFVRWNGAEWEPAGGGVDGPVGDLIVHDDGSGPALFLIGQFMTRDGSAIQNLARWDGSTWSDVGGAAPTNPFSIVSDGGVLYVGGSFDSIGGVAAQGIAAWDGDDWTAFGLGIDGSVSAIAVHDDGSGPALYAAGNARRSGTQTIDNIARWDGSAWMPLESGLGSSREWVNALASHNDGSGPTLFAGGNFFDSGDVWTPLIATWRCPPGSCPADFDSDGRLTLFDFLAFQNAFDSGDLAADFDGDGRLTLFDFLAFQNEFDTGC